MRGYPKTINTGRDYDNLMSIPEYAARAKSDLALASAVDDSKVVVDIGTVDKPSLKEVVNPSPLYKRLGYKSKSAMVSASSVDVAEELK